LTSLNLIQYFELIRRYTYILQLKTILMRILGVTQLLLALLITTLFVSCVPKSSFAVADLNTAVFGQHRYMVYQNLSDTGHKDIYFRESHDGGETFSHPTDLTEKYVNATTPRLDPNTNPKIGAFADDVYIIWHGKISGGNTNLFYMKSSDGGITFRNATDVSENKNVNVIQSALTVDRNTGDVFVAYINSDGSVVPCHVHCND
jgi:hypothetical protein